MPDRPSSATSPSLTAPASTTTETGRVTSAGGTSIAVGRSGAGPAVILVHGAFTDRAHPTLSGVAAALARAVHTDAAVLS